MPSMKSIENLEIKHLESLVHPYQNLFHHRTVILEGIRKIAFRNMIHLENTMNFLEESSKYGSKDKLKIERIKAKMLTDQGLENNTTNQAVIEWATFFPLQLYLALLYAEIEFYQRSMAQNPILFYKDFSNYIDDNKELLYALKQFRNSFLHPNTNQYSLERAFLQTSPSYNIAPELQNRLDEYIRRLRISLLNTLKEELFQLPEIQQVYCQDRFLHINIMRMSYHQDIQGIMHCEDQVRKLSYKMEHISNADRSWQPTPQQRDKGYRLAECLNIVSPSGPEQELTPPETLQPPIHDNILSFLSSLILTPPISTTTDRYTNHIKRSLRSYCRIVITGLVLLNENHHLSTALLKADPANEQILKDPEALTSVLLDHVLQLPFQLKQEHVARIRIIVALCYELLRVYRDLITENNLLPHPKLNSFLSNQSFKHLRLLRNSIFHVVCGERDPYKIDWNFIGRDNIDITGLFLELSKFIMSYSGFPGYLSTS